VPTRRMLIALTVLAGVLVVGTLGYALIEGWGLRESLYMTVITAATVGFEEVHPLSPAGEVFTMVLVITGVGALGFSFGVFVDFLSEGRVLSMLEERRMNQTIEHLSGHHILVGLGRVGSVVADLLADAGAPFVVIERDPDVIDRAHARGWLMVSGDATQEPVLVQAGIERAASLIAALDSDGANMFVTVIAKTLNPDLLVVARSEREASESALLKSGANRVATPNVIGGRRLANFVLRPLASDYIDLVTHSKEVEFDLQDVELPEDSPLVGKSIREAMVRDRYGTYILAIRHPDGTIDTNPDMDRVILAGSVLVVLGTPHQIATLISEV
jgi:voltage-gated potassium channel